MTYLVWTVEYNITDGRPALSVKDELGQQSQIPLDSGLEEMLNSATGQKSVTLKLEHSQGRIAELGLKPRDQCLLDATFVEFSTGHEYGGTGRGTSEDFALLDAFLTALKQRRFSLAPEDIRSTIITYNVP